MTRPHTATALALGAFTLLGYLYFPGHAWLEQDTQIYVALLQHLDQPSALARDLVCQHPHLKWTVYDEVARTLHVVTGLSYRVVLDAQLLVFRFLGLAGIFLLAAAAGLNRAGALFTAFLFGLGAFVGGPEILTLEYEPVPRAFALMLVLAALGYGAFGKWKISATLAALALLYHAPTSAPYWLAAVVYAVYSQRLRVFRTVMIAFFSASLLLLLAASFQAGEREVQPLFAQIPADLIAVLRYRGAYVWVDLWKAEWLRQYALLGAFAALAWWRIRRRFDPEMRILSACLLLYGLASVPLSWLLLNVMRWTMMAPFQPARAVVFVVIFAIVLGAAAAWTAARNGRFLEAFAWLLPLFALPTNRPVLEPFTAAPFSALAAERLALVAALALAAAWLARYQDQPGSRSNQVVQAQEPACEVELTPGAGLDSVVGRTPTSARDPQVALWRSATALLVPIAAALLLPTLGHVSNYPHSLTPQLESLAAWARTSTNADAVFYFADAGHATSPGIFRVLAERALYVDWKGGGQVNQSRSIAAEWPRRWDWANRAQAPFRSSPEYAAAGIDFVVTHAGADLSGSRPTYENPDWRVFDVRLVLPPHPP